MKVPIERRYRAETSLIFTLRAAGGRTSPAYGSSDCQLVATQDTSAAAAARLRCDRDSNAVHYLQRAYGGRSTSTESAFRRSRPCARGLSGSCIASLSSTASPPLCP